MAMMAKMRSLAPAFIITVGALFVLFMVISDSNVLEALGGRSNNVGSVNGVDITYQEFVSAIDIQRENQKAQTGEEIEEENMDQLREQVWDAVVTQTLVAEQVDKFGITVSDQEVRDIILGNNPPEFLKRNFIDSTGNFNRQLYDQAIFDPRNKEALLQAEEFVRQNRLNEKLQSLLLASITVSEVEIKRKFIDQNTKMDVQYALVEISQFPDSLLNVTGDEMKAYYNKNIDKHKTFPQRKLKYILFSNTASSEDSANMKSNLENVAENLKSDTLDFMETAEIYSSVPYSKDTLSLAAIPEAALEKISKAEPGSVIGPVAAPEGFVLYKVSEIIPSDKTLVRASHILINQHGSDEKNYEEAMKVYNQLTSGGNFESIAKERSADPGSAVKGGDLGWFSKGDMVPEFEKAAFSGEVGLVQKPVKSSFGYHIVKVTGKSNKDFVIEKIVNPIKASASTTDANFNAAQDFAYLAEKNGFEKEAKILNYEINETAPFLEEAVSVPGIGVNKRIIDFAFNNDINTTSDPFRVQNGYVVVQISEVIKEGIKQFEEVKDILKPNVIREKKFEKAKTIAEGIKNKINGDLSKASSINSKVTVNKTGSFTPGTSSVPAIGRDYAFIEKALDMELNKVSEPVKGMRGYYLLKVIEKSPFDSAAYEAQRSSIRDNILQEKKSTYFNQWLTKLKADANIVDNRYMFFGQ